MPDSGPRVPGAARPRAALSREQLIANIAARVRPAVPGLPDGEFEALVGRMADLELKCRDRLTPTWSPALPPPRAHES